MCSSLSTMEKARIQLQETPEQMLYFFLDGGIPAEPLKQKTLASSSTPPPAQLLLQHCHAIPNTAPEILRSYTDSDLTAIIEMMEDIVETRPVQHKDSEAIQALVPFIISELEFRQGLLWC